MNKDEYYAFLESDDWRNFSADFKRRRENVCELCGSHQNLQTHHMSYGDLFDEDNLICLCKNCHQCTHRALEKYKKDIGYRQIIDTALLNDYICNVIVDFFFNSYCAIDTDCKKNLLEPDELRKISSHILESVDIWFKCGNDVKIHDGYRILKESMSEYGGCINKARQAIAQARNEKIKEALLDGFPSYTIKKRFRMSENSWNKAVNHQIDWAEKR
jgi:hypothetical protein